VVVGGTDSITAAPPSPGSSGLRETPETLRIEQALAHPPGGNLPAPTMLQMSEDRRHVAVMYQNGELVVWDITALRVIFRHRYDNLGLNPGTAATVVALADDGRYLAVSPIYPFSDDVIHVTDLSTGSDVPVRLPAGTRNRPPDPSLVSALDFAPDHRLLITTDRRTEKLAVFDPTTDRLINLGPRPEAEFEEGRYAPDGQTVVGATRDRVIVWPTGQPPQTINRLCLSVSAEGLWVDVHLPPGGRTIHCVSSIEAAVLDAVTARRIARLHSQYQFRGDIIDLPRGFASFSVGPENGAPVDYLEVFAADGKPLARQTLSPGLTHGPNVIEAAYADPGLAIMIVGSLVNPESRKIRVLQFR
jgi:hypothetical protein